MTALDGLPVSFMFGFFSFLSNTPAKRSRRQSALKIASSRQL
jgi:hypothetical protein